MKVQSLLRCAVMATAGLVAAVDVSMAEESGVTLTPMIGSTTRIHDEDSELEDTHNASLAVGYKFSSPWAVELAYLVSEPTYKLTDESFDLSQVRLDALYYINSDKNVTPFVLMGVGQQSISSGSADSKAALFNAGVGVKAKILDKLSFRGDVRGIILNNNYINNTNVDAGINLGIQWLFGSNSSSAVAAVAVVDTDGDGVVDSLDSCPNTPAGLEVDATGCQLKQDDDNDGVLNAVDECPSTKAGAKVDELGCYAVIAEDVTVSLNVTFANNSEKMVSGTDQIQKVATFMREYPETLVVIEGHTDSLGAAAYNESLSQRRAETVAAELTGRFGIDASRVSAMGYGESKPVASNDTNEGRAANRRVSAVVQATVDKVAE